IINITGNHTLTTHETNEAVTLIMEAADEDAEIIFGIVIDENMGDDVKVTVIATGLQIARQEAMMSKPEYMAAPIAEPVRTYEAPKAPVAPIIEEQPVVQAQAPKTDYAVKSEITFDLEGAKEE